MMGKLTGKRRGNETNNGSPEKKRQRVLSSTKNERIFKESSTGNKINVIKTKLLGSVKNVGSSNISTHIKQPQMHHIETMNQQAIFDDERMNKKTVEKIFLKSLQIIPKNRHEFVAIERLCKRLNWELLAMKHAAACIKDHLHSDPDVEKAIVKYLVEIGKESRAPNSIEYLKNVKDGNMPIYLTTGVTFMKLKATGEIGKMSLKIMEVMSFLSADSIDPQFVWYLYQKIENQELCGIHYNAFRLLTRYSMIYFDSDKLISVNGLVQKITRMYLTKHREVKIVSKIMSAIQEMDSNYYPIQLMNHSETAWECASEIEELNEESKKFSLWITNKCIIAGKYKEAYDLSLRALTIHKSILEEDNKWSLKMKYFKASALEGLEENKKSLDLLIKVHKKQKEICKEDKSDLLTTASHIGLAYYKLKQLECAMIWFNNTLQKRQKINGDDKEILVLKNNIAVVLESQMKFKEAQTLYEEVLKLQTQKLGIEDEATLATKQNLACVRFYMEEYDEALKIFQEVWEIEKRVVDVSHPYILTTKAWIVAALDKLERLEEAKVLAKEVYQERMDILGKRHPDTIVSKISFENLWSRCHWRK